MGVSPVALFSDLVSDLTDAVGGDPVDSFRSGCFSWPGISKREFAASSIYQSLLKKLESGMNESTKAAALSKFLRINEDCKNWELQLEYYGDDFLMGEFKDTLHRFWRDRTRQWAPLLDHDYDVLEKGRLGPGASIASDGGDFYTKLFDSQMSCTNRHLYLMYRRYIRGFPEWNNADNVRVLHHGETCVVRGNRLSFVPKNDDISRSICVEPTLNMYYQLGFAEILNSRLYDLWGINLKNQQFKNRELARVGSLYGSFSTIDLSSASDSMSLKMLRHVLPKDFLYWLERYRCPETTLPNGEPCEFGMVSTMGNGYTFSLQTVLFTCVVVTAMQLSGIPPIYPRGSEIGNFGVYGDDIICPSACTQKVLRLLKLLGFTPNSDKTFVEGLFRESCGEDFFEGINVRGVYIKNILTQQDLYSAINQLNLFSTRTGILLPKLVQSLLKNCKYLPVPRWENDDSGIKVPLSYLRRPFRIDKDTQSILYFCRRPRPSRIRIGESALFVPKTAKRRLYNPSGLHISFLQGSVKSHCILVRQDKVTYETKPGIAPYWDALPAVHPLTGWFNWQRWETAVYLNLCS